VLAVQSLFDRVSMELTRAQQSNGQIHTILQHQAHMIDKYAQQCMCARVTAVVVLCTVTIHQEALLHCQQQMKHMSCGGQGGSVTDVITADNIVSVVQTAVGEQIHEMVCFLCVCILSKQMLQLPYLRDQVREMIVNAFADAFDRCIVPAFNEAIKCWFVRIDQQVANTRCNCEC
jgi:hypothetical protein